MTTIRTPTRLHYPARLRAQVKTVCTLRGWSFQKQNRREEEKEGDTEQQQTYQFTQGYSNIHRLQVHHLTLPQ